MLAVAVQSLHNEQGLLELTGIACIFSLDMANLYQDPLGYMMRSTFTP